MLRPGSWTWAGWQAERGDVGSSSGQREPGQCLRRRRTHRLSCHCRGGGCGVSDKLKRKREGGRKTDRRGGEAEGAERACSTASKQREESAQRSDSWGSSAMAGAHRSLKLCGSRTAFMGDSLLPQTRGNRASSHLLCLFRKHDLPSGTGPRLQVQGLTWIPDLLGHWVCLLCPSPSV